MQTTHVSLPIMTDQPDEAVLFGEFFDPALTRSSG
jgi:hypothetical protein